MLVHGISNNFRIAIPLFVVLVDDVSLVFCIEIFNELLERNKFNSFPRSLVFHSRFTLR